MLTAKNINLYLEDYTGCRGSNTTCTFFDGRGNSIEINSETLYCMFRFMMKELEGQGTWDRLENSVVEKYPGLGKVFVKDW